jgi:hypothetical protein
MGDTEYRAVNVYKITCIFVHKDVYEIRRIVLCKTHVVTRMGYWQLQGATI